MYTLDYVYDSMETTDILIRLNWTDWTTNRKTGLGVYIVQIHSNLMNFIHFLIRVHIFSFQWCSCSACANIHLFVRKCNDSDIIQNCISFLFIFSVDLDHILCSWKYSMHSYRTLLAISCYTLVMRNDYQNDERFCVWICSMEMREHTHSTAQHRMHAIYELFHLLRNKNMKL